MYDIQSRWKLENGVLRYYGLRNPPNLFKNTVKLTKKQQAILEKLPCRLTPEEIDILKNLMGVQVVEINADDYPAIAEDYGLTKVPTTVFYAEGIKLRSIEGAFTSESLGNYLHALLTQEEDEAEEP